MKLLLKDDNEHIMSNHDALEFEIFLPSSAPSSNQSKELIESSKLTINHLKWEEADLEFYWKNLERFLQQILKFGKVLKIFKF
jgi:hypothetical protein